MDKYRYGRLVIDEKWSVLYDPDRNCRPTALQRYGETVPDVPSMWNNVQLAMFYKLLELENG